MATSAEFQSTHIDRDKGLEALLSQARACFLAQHNISACASCSATFDEHDDGAVIAIPMRRVQPAGIIVDYALCESCFDAEAIPSIG